MTAASLLEVISDLAPGAAIRHRPEGRNVLLNQAQLELATVSDCDGRRWGGWTPAIDVVAYSKVSVVFPADRFGYEGRSHSLYFCDAQQPGHYGWFETAFMDTPPLPAVGRQGPFDLHPCEDAGKALSNSMTEYQVAWPFTELVTGESDEFVDRWVGWFAAAVDGRLSRPSTMPEKPTGGSWRRS